MEEDKVWDALAAQLDEIVSELPYGLYTLLVTMVLVSLWSTSKISFSKGFLQIKFLILDEATSALDNRTESEVMQSQNDWTKMHNPCIAHSYRPQKCDRIYEFLDGKIVASGKFEQLRETSSSFRTMIELQSFDAMC